MFNVRKTVAKMAILAGLTTMAGALTAAQAPAQEPAVTMTLYNVQKDSSGQPYFLLTNGEAVSLPGAGAKTNTVAVYSGPAGRIWYVDQNGKTHKLAHPLSNVDSGDGLEAELDAMPPLPPPAEKDKEVKQPSTTTGNTANTVDGLPIGITLWWSHAGSAYYWVPGGKRVFLTRTKENEPYFQQWAKQGSYWHRDFWETSRWGLFPERGKAWDPKNNWPGKEHGFPAPWTKTTN